MMAATIGTALPCLWFLQRRLPRMTLPNETPARRHVLGGALFGVGFGVTATCPGITIAMAATGGLYGFVVLAGILGGLVLRGRVEPHPRPARVAVSPSDDHVRLRGLEPSA